MLTDEDLTRELGEALKTATQDLTYSGRRRPPSAMATAVSTTALAGVATVAAVGVATAGGSGPGAKAVARTPHSAVSPQTGATHGSKLVTHKMQLAGMTLTYATPADAPYPVFLSRIVDGDLPDGLTPVALKRTDAKAWSGTDAKTGYPAIYVQLDADDSAIYELMTSNGSEVQLLDLVEKPAPAPDTDAATG